MLISKVNLLAIVLLWSLFQLLKLLSNIQTNPLGIRRRKKIAFNWAFNSIPFKIISIQFDLLNISTSIIFLISKTLWTDKIGTFWWCGQVRNLNTLDLNTLESQAYTFWKSSNENHPNFDYNWAKLWIKVLENQSKAMQR